MARIVPSDLGISTGIIGHEDEIETLRTLQTELPRNHTVFHSVHWTQVVNLGTRFGEIDFVVVGPDGRIIVIEQKNGRLGEVDGKLVKFYGKRRKPVGKQISRNISNLRKKYSIQNPRRPGLVIDYLLYCPDHQMRSVHGVSIDRERVVDASRKDQLPAIIRKLFEKGDPKQLPDRREVLRFFEDELELVPDVSAYIEAGEQVFTRLSGGLIETIRSLEFEPFRLRILGVAGSGKSQAARDFYNRTEPGSHALYVCYNRPQCERMRKTLQSRDGTGVVETFHGLCARALQEAGVEIDFSIQENDPGFWQNFAERVLEVDLPDSLRFDRIVLDEGQDFPANWIEILTELFFKDGYQLLWLEDPAQNLRDTPAIGAPTTVTFHANKSFRTPSSIAEFVAETHAIDYQSASPLPGMGVGVHPYRDPDAQERMVYDLLCKLRNRGFANREIVVLTCLGLKKSPLYHHERFGKISIRKFTGEYEADGQPVYSRGSVLFDSVYRYKGGQSPAVILVDVDPDQDRVNRGRPVVFCGMTRATTRLDMLVDEGNPSNACYLEAGSEDL